MRSTTLLAHLWRVSILAVALLALPQLASAQLPLETKSLKIQATTGTNTVTLTASTVTTPYALNYPATGSPGGGAFLFATNGTGDLGWTNAPTADQTTLFWNGTSVVWVDPNSANNPNWSLKGNALADDLGKLGTTTAFNVSIVTNNVTRIALDKGGDVTISGAAAGNTTIGSFAGNDVTIGNATGDVGITGTTAITGATSVTGATNINTTGTAATSIGAAGGTTTITGTTNINNAAIATTNIGFAGGTLTTAGALGHTGTSSFTGAVTLAGASSPLVANTGAGTAGDVLVSDGAANTPQWQNLNNAIGIRKAGHTTVTSATSITVTAVTGLTISDAIIVTIEGSVGVTASVFSRNTTTGEFVVRFSGEYTGELNFMVIKQL